MGTLCADASHVHVLGRVLHWRIRTTRHDPTESDQRVLALGQLVPDRVHDKSSARSTQGHGRIHGPTLLHAQTGLVSHADTRRRTCLQLGIDRLPVGVYAKYTIKTVGKRK